MKKIEIKNLEVLSQVIVNFVSNLKCAGYHSGTTQYVHEGKNLSGITEWWVRNFDSVIKGGTFTVASVIENQNDDNYDYAGESLTLVSTPLKSGNVLIEIVYHSIIDKFNGFHSIDDGKTVKCYLCEVK